MKIDGTDGEDKSKPTQVHLTQFWQRWKSNRGRKLPQAFCEAVTLILKPEKAQKIENYRPTSSILFRPQKGLKNIRK